LKSKMSKPLRNQFTIPVFPHVRKFMLKTYSHRAGIFKSEEYTQLGKLVTLALCDPRAWKNSNDQERDRLTSNITLLLNAEQCKMGPRLFKLQRINLDMDRQFKEYLVLWIKAQADLGRGAHPACCSFLEAYDLDPYGTEYNLDSAYKFTDTINLLLDTSTLLQRPLMGLS
jgi:hypothetical protein